MAVSAARSAVVYRAHALNSNALKATAVTQHRPRRRLVRIAAVVTLALCLAPVTWLRSGRVEPDSRALLSLTPLALPQPVAGQSITAVGAWELTSSNGHFGGYSALLVQGTSDHPTFFAASDRGRFLRFTLADAVPVFGAIAGSVANTKAAIDVEAVTRDPETGRLWFAYEGRNLIERRSASLSETAWARPEAMADWGGNSGPEAMVRLAGGWFVVLSEGPQSRFGELHRGLLFAGDPVLEPRVIAFSFAPPSGYRPVDLAQLPDGRVLILVRRFIFGLPPRFETKLLVADPRDIAGGADWTAHEIASIAPLLPSDNYEGLDVMARADGNIDIWLISDDNAATFQRTLLLKLRWDIGAPDTVKR